MKIAGAPGVSLVQADENCNHEQFKFLDFHTIAPRILLDQSR